MKLDNGNRAVYPPASSQEELVKRGRRLHAEAVVTQLSRLRQKVGGAVPFFRQLPRIEGHSGPAKRCVVPAQPAK